MNTYVLGFCTVLVSVFACLVLSTRKRGSWDLRWWQGAAGTGSNQRRCTRAPASDCCVTCRAVPDFETEVLLALMDFDSWEFVFWFSRLPRSLRRSLRNLVFLDTLQWSLPGNNVLDFGSRPLFFLQLERFLFFPFGTPNKGFLFFERPPVSAFGS